MYLAGKYYFTLDRHFTWSSEAHVGLAACRVKEYLHFSVILRPLSTCSPTGIEPATSLSSMRDWSKSIGKVGVGRSRDGVGHEVLSLVQGVGRAIFSYP